MATPVNKIALRENMNRSFSLDEIESLCFDLGVDFENIGGSSKPSKILELIQYLDRRGRLPELSAACAKARPNVDWGLVGAPAVDTDANGARQVRTQPIVTSTEKLGPIENRLALVVGINSYVESNRFPTLSYCIQDAIGMQTALQGCGYAVRLMHDEFSYSTPQFPTRENIRAELKDLCSKTNSNDLLLVYFACHGVVLPDGRQFLIAQNTRSALLEETALALAEIQSMMKSQSKARRGVVVLDACHSGADARASVSEDDVVFQAMDNAYGFATIAASTSKQVANEAGGHGLFTKYVIEALSGQATAAYASQAKIVTAASLRNYALAGVRKWTIEHGRALQEPSSVDAVVGDMILADFRKST